MLALAVVILLACSSLAEAAGKRSRRKNLQKDIWEPLAVLGVIALVLVLPLLGMLVWRVARDPMTPLLAKELYYRFLACCFDDGTWKRRRRAAPPAEDGEEDEGGGPVEAEAEDEDSAHEVARERRRERRRNLRELRAMVVEDRLREAVETVLGASEVES